jgi:RNA polymerase sigma factor (sigma-70 family)
MRNLQKRILVTVIPTLAQSILQRFGAKSTQIGELAAHALRSMSIIDNQLHSKEKQDSLQLMSMLVDIGILSEEGFTRNKEVFHNTLKENINEMSLLEWAIETPVTLWKYHRTELQGELQRISEHQHTLNQIVYTLSGLSLISYSLIYALVSDQKIHKSELKLLKEIIFIFEKPDRLIDYITKSAIAPSSRNVLYSEIYRHVNAFTQSALIPLQLMQLITRVHATGAASIEDSSQRWAIIVDEVTELDTAIITNKGFFEVQQPVPSKPKNTSETTTTRSTNEVHTPVDDLTMSTSGDQTSSISDDEEWVQRAVELHLLAEEEYGRVSITDGEEVDPLVAVRPLEPRWELIVTELRSRDALTFEHIENEIAQAVPDSTDRIDAYQYIMERLLSTGVRIYDDTVVDTPARTLTLKEVEQLVADVSERFADSLFAEYSFENQRIFLYHDLLSASEERDLTQARLMVSTYAATTTTERERMRCADLEQQIRETLINHNYRLVMRTAVTAHYGQNIQHLDQMDLFQEGCIGLINAIDKFDGSRGYKISTYATWWIRQAIYRAIDNQERGIRLPVHFLDLIRRYKRESKKLAERLEREPTSVEIAEQMSRSVKLVETLVYWDRRIASLDQSVGEEDSTLKDFVPGDNMPETGAMQNELAETLDRYLSKFPEREQIIITLRFGLNGNHIHTLEEIGRKFGITRERVRQIEVICLKRLRRYPELRAHLE